jgi:ribosomal protein L22
LSKEQRAKTKEQRTKSKEQRTITKELRNKTVNGTVEYFENYFRLLYSLNKDYFR